MLSRSSRVSKFMLEKEKDCHTRSGNWRTESAWGTNQRALCFRFQRRKKICNLLRYDFRRRPLRGFRALSRRLVRFFFLGEFFELFKSTYGFDKFSAPKSGAWSRSLAHSTSFRRCTVRWWRVFEKNFANHPTNHPFMIGTRPLPIPETPNMYTFYKKCARLRDCRHSPVSASLNPSLRPTCRHGSPPARVNRVYH